MATLGVPDNARGTFGLVLVTSGIVVLSSAALVYLRRREKFWRRYSPVFLVGMCVGVLLQLASAWSGVIAPRSSVGCDVQLWLDRVGFSMFFSFMVVKVYRVFKIFRNRLLRSWLMNGRLVLGLSMGLFCVGAVFATLNAVFVPHAYDDALGTCTRDVSSAGAIVIKGLTSCYELCLMLATCAISYMSRDLPDQYNESRTLVLPVTAWALARLLVGAMDSFFGASETVMFLTDCVVVGAAVASFGAVFVGKFLAYFGQPGTMTEGRVSGIRIASAWSNRPDTAQAITEAFNNLSLRLGTLPSYLRIDCTEHYDAETILNIVHQMAPACALHGATTTFGVMTEEGVHEHSIGLWGLYDPDSSGYGVAGGQIGDEPRAVGARVANQAMASCGKEFLGKCPDVILMTSAPGKEEEILRGIQDNTGPGVKITGGSSGDDNVAGNWRQFFWDAHNNKPIITTDGLVLTAMYTSVHVSASFYSGYAPSPYSGVVTKVGDRRIIEIDGDPAALVYSRWTGNRFRDMLYTGGNIVGPASLFPLGREIGKDIDYVSHYQLVLPTGINADNTLDTLAEVYEGETLTLMAGTTDNLKNTITRRAVQGSGFKPSEIRGAFVVYCAGCMLAVKEQLDQVMNNLVTSIGKQPFMAAFTLGEQGTFPTGEIRHGNNMFSVLTFSSIPKDNYDAAYSGDMKVGNSNFVVPTNKPPSTPRPPAGAALL